MAMRSVVGKLKALTLRMPRFGAAAPKFSQRSTEQLDPAKFASVKDYTVAALDNMEKEMRRDLEELRRLKKAYDRGTLAAHGVAAAASVFCVWSLVDSIVEDED